MLQGSLSLQHPIGTDREGNEISLLDVIESPPVDVVEDCFKRDNISHLLKHIKNSLSPKEYHVICCRYGLGGQEPLTQRKSQKISSSAVPMYPASKKMHYENSELFFPKSSKGRTFFRSPLVISYSPLRRISNTSGVSVSFT